MVESTAAFLVRQIQTHLLDRPATPVWLALPGGAGKHAHTRNFRAWPYPLVQCVVRGHLRLRFRDARGPCLKTLSRGALCYSLPYGWDLRDYETARELLVLHVPATHVLIDYTRFDCTDGRPATQHRSHTLPRPVNPAWQAILTALNENALHRADPIAAWHLLQALGRLIRDALASGATTEGAVGAAEATYRMLARYVEANAFRPINRNEVAGEFGLAPDYVSRLFARHGEGFNRLLTRLRMERAVELLADTRLDVADIAARCGYASANYFIKTFRKHQGCPPGAYRERFL